MNKIGNVLSLFDGMSCGQIALNRASIKYDKYFACEIDKHAIKVTQANYPETIQLGDVSKVKGSDLPKIDLLIGGSPCQGFSFAGKQLAFNDPRSVLFFEYVRMLNECRPKYFLLENVKMKKEHELVISRYLGIDPIEINSNLVSAQNRGRLYWTNIGAQPDGLFSQLTCMIRQPEDKGILLKDILEENVDKKYYLKNPKINFEGLDLDEKSRTLRTSGRDSQSDKHNHNLICVASRGRDPENPKSRKTGLPTSQVIEPRFDGKTNCLTSVGKDNLIFAKNYIQWDVGGKGHNSQQSRAFYEAGKYGSLVAQNRTEKVVIKNTIRRLTPIECERLQTVPDNYTAHVSDSQRYKMLGNGWTVDVIAHIFSYAKIP